MYPLTSELSSIQVFMFPCLPLVIVLASIAEKERLALGCVCSSISTFPQGFSFFVRVVMRMLSDLSGVGVLKNSRSATILPQLSKKVIWFTPSGIACLSISISMIGAAVRVSHRKMLPLCMRT